jgi:hypothetical protein
MTFRIKVNKPAGPKFYYALGLEAVKTLLDELYAAGSTNVVLSRIA